MGGNVNALSLISRCRELGIKLATGREGKLRVSPPPEKLPEDLREELRCYKQAILAYLRQAEKYPLLNPEEREFLTRHAPNLPWKESPGWEALMVWVPTLAMLAWIVRDRETGQEYARETGSAALVLNEVATLKWRTSEEAREALLPLLITPGGVQ